MILWKKRNPDPWPAAPRYEIQLYDLTSGRLLRTTSHSERGLKRTFILDEDLELYFVRLDCEWLLIRQVFWRRTAPRGVVALLRNAPPDLGLPVGVSAHLASGRRDDFGTGDELSSALRGPWRSHDTMTTSTRLLFVLGGFALVAGCALTPLEVRQQAAVLPVDELLDAAEESQRHRDVALVAVMNLASQRCDAKLIAGLLRLGANPAIRLYTPEEAAEREADRRPRQRLSRNRPRAARRYPLRTPFTVAVQHCDGAVVAAFLEGGVSIKDYLDAAKWPIAAITKRLAEIDVEPRKGGPRSKRAGVGSSRKQSDWREALLRERAFGVLNALLEAGADPHHIRAVLGGRPRTREVRQALVRKLIAHGADVNRGNLLEAALGDRRMVEFLLRSGVQLKRCETYPPLLAAVERCYERVSPHYCDTARFLLRRGASPQCAYQAKEPRWKKGLTPLHLAAGFGDVPMATLLLERGADPSAYTRPKRVTPLHRALGDQHLRAQWHRLRVKEAKRVRLRRRYTHGIAVSREETARAVASSRLEMVHLLLSHGADPSSGQYKDYWITPLHLAIHARSSTGEKVKLVSLLLAYGANLDQKDRKGRGALHWAVRSGGQETLPLVRLLLANGLNPQARDKRSWSPIDLVQEASKPIRKGLRTTLRQAAGLE